MDYVKLMGIGLFIKGRSFLIGFPYIETAKVKAPNAAYLVAVEDGFIGFSELGDCFNWLSRCDETAPILARSKDFQSIGTFADWLQAYADGRIQPLSV